MDLVVIGILSVALVLIVIRRCKKAKEEKKPIELVGIGSLAVALLLIILRRIGA